MGRSEDVITAIKHIHAAGLDAELWPEALSHVTKLFGGRGASLEFIERPLLRCRGMYSFGLSGAAEYVEHYARMSPRLPYCARQPVGSIVYDGQYYDDKAIDEDPFYMEFLTRYDMRYFLGAMLVVSPQNLIATSVQISPKEGHPTPAKIKLMKVLLPHFQQAVDVMQRLGHLSNAQGAFEHTLDWLADGVLMLARDGVVRHANLAARKILRAHDGIAVRRGALQFVSAEATAKLGAAMQAIGQLGDSDARATMQSDFTAGRPSTAPGYVVSVRPLLARIDDADAAVALLFIHDPLVKETTNVEFLVQIFGLTRAEAEVASALCSGLSPDEYAQQCNISPNTVYTHIRRLKEKTGSKRMTALIRKLNDVQAAAVARREQ
jgi:DNA-binding CsgD family transcriptional regulator